MDEKDVLHVRINEDVLKNVESFVNRGLFSNKNEAVREAIRIIILKYRDEVKK